MRSRLSLIIVLVLLPLSFLQAQKEGKKTEISGIVVDAGDNPIANAIVMIDGKNTSVVTDASGKYRIKVKSSASRIGIFTFNNGIKEEAIGGRNEINFKFGNSTGINSPVQDNEPRPGEEGINTGYSYIKKKNLSTDVSKIDGTKSKYGSYKSVYEMIEREVSGVKIIGNDIVLRDSKDFFGSVPALLVVDGTYVDDLSSIQPATVESIEVLKGASSSMYGSRGYGGVIILKTKLKN